MADLPQTNSAIITDYYRSPGNTNPVQIGLMSVICKVIWPFRTGLGSQTSAIITND